jgi:1,4-dihydroxy-2-naphthoate polyprenyltransferase
MSTTLRNGKAWLQAARPKTLGAAVAPVFVGFFLARALTHTALETWLLCCTLISTLALQVATNGFNDVLDFQQGKDTAARIGPQRITAAGVLKPQQVMLAACVMLAVAMLAAVPLIEARGWPIVAIGVPSLYFCYGYTGGPVPLAYRGLGELFVILFFGFVAVMGAAFVQSGQALWPMTFVAGAQVGCLSTVLIAINNLRDLAEDRQTGKRTLAVRFGVTFARLEMTLLIGLAYGGGLYWRGLGMARLEWFPCFAAPIGIFLLFKLWTTPPSRAYNGLLALAGVQLLLFSALFCWACVNP